MEGAALWCRLNVSTPAWASAAVPRSWSEQMRNLHVINYWEAPLPASPSMLARSSTEQHVTHMQLMAPAQGPGGGVQPDAWWDSEGFGRKQPYSPHSRWRTSMMRICRTSTHVSGWRHTNRFPLDVFVYNSDCVPLDLQEETPILWPLTALATAPLHKL